MKLCKQSRESWRETTNTNHPLKDVGEESFLKTLPTRVHFTIEEKNVTVDFIFCLIPVLSELTQHRLFELLSQGVLLSPRKREKKEPGNKIKCHKLTFHFELPNDCFYSQFVTCRALIIPSVSFSNAYDL